MRAVASLEMGKRVVASLEISSPGGAIVVYVLGAMAPGPFGDSREWMWLLGLSASPGSGRDSRGECDRINLFPTTSELYAELYPIGNGLFQPTIQCKE